MARRIFPVLWLLLSYEKSPAFAGLFFGREGEKTKRKSFAFRCAQFDRHFFGASTGKKSILLTKFMRSFKFVKEEFTFTVKNVV